MSKIQQPKEREVIKDDEGNPIYYYFDEPRFVDGTPTGKGGEILYELPGFDKWFEELKANIFKTPEQQQIQDQVTKYVNTSPSYSVPIASSGLGSKHLIGAAVVIFAGALAYKFIFKKRGRR